MKNLQPEDKINVPTSQFQFFINNIKFESDRFITPGTIRQYGNIPEDFSIFLKQRGKQVEIEDGATIDLAANGVEHFFSAQNPARNKVSIHVNINLLKIQRGNQPVSEIKKIAGVPSTDELEQLIEGKLIPLKDDAQVVIKGGEVFFSHVRDGASS